MTCLMLVVSEGYIIYSRWDGFTSKVLDIDDRICKIAGRIPKMGPYLLIEMDKVPGTHLHPHSSSH